MNLSMDVVKFYSGLAKAGHGNLYLFTAGRVRLGNGWGLDIGAWT
jgi:hypothetical protein